VEITRSEGVVPPEKCKDVKLIHDENVGDKQIDCLYCHTRIEHGKIKMAAELPK
jgi:hypothetical protein